MDSLFENCSDPSRNLLPKDGTVLYYGKIFEKELADSYYEKLFYSLAWKNDKAVIFGKVLVTKRKVAWYADQPLEYTYSKITKTALPWMAELLELKKQIEKTSGETFNSCLANLYHSGDEGMAWHSDAEKDLKKHGAIASLTLGAERKFAFKHKISKEVVSLTLEHGSLLIMKDEIQDFWLHRLPPTKKITEPRINLTFRTVTS